MDPWTDDMDARERVRTIATSLSQPRSVNWIAEEADVSWQTTSDELDRLVDHAQVQRVYPEGADESDADPRYLPDYRTMYLSRIRELSEEYARGELRAAIAKIQDEIHDWKDEYNVENRADLESTLGDPELTGEAVRERNRVLRQWRRNEETRRLLQHALDLYDDLADLDSEPESPSLA